MRFTKGSGGVSLDADTALWVSMCDGYEEIQPAELSAILGALLVKLYEADVLSHHDVAEIIGHSVKPEDTK